MSKHGSSVDRARQPRAGRGHSRVSAEHLARAPDARGGGARGAASLFADRQLAADADHPPAGGQSWRASWTCRCMSVCATGIRIIADTLQTDGSLTMWDKWWRSAWRRTIRVPALACTKKCLFGEAVPFPIDFVEEWHDHPLLIEAFAEKLRSRLDKGLRGARLAVAGAVYRAQRAHAHHHGRRSLRSADARDRCAGGEASSGDRRAGNSPSKARACRAENGSGPRSKTPLRHCRARVQTGVFVQPIGFVCDHVEILFDIDILFRQFAAERGMKLYRAESLNDSPTFAQGHRRPRSRAAGCAAACEGRSRLRRCNSHL